MSNWPATKGGRVLAALLRIGWQRKRQTGSHLVLSRVGWPDMCGHSMTAKKSVPRCSLALQRKPVSSRKICSTSYVDGDMVEVDAEKGIVRKIA